MKPLIHFHITITGPDEIGTSPEELALIAQVRDALTRDLPEVLTDELGWLTVASVLGYTVQSTMEGDHP